MKIDKLKKRLFILQDNIVRTNEDLLSLHELAKVMKACVNHEKVTIVDRTNNSVIAHQKDGKLEFDTENEEISGVVIHIYHQTVGHIVSILQ